LTPLRLGLVPGRALKGYRPDAAQRRRAAGSSPAGAEAYEKYRDVEPNATAALVMEKALWMSTAVKYHSDW
jgi:hypothetical protein